MTLLTLPSASSLALSVRAKALVFEDPKSVALLERVREIAPLASSLLITGETGTGRELVARHVHELSARASRPFLAVSCSGFAEAAADGELFGRVKGFDGATSGKTGWLEAAQGGTLFLDEIADLSPKSQLELLRVLQRGELVRRGADQPIPIDVRLIAASDVDLPHLVTAGRFRDDLFAGLSRVTLALSPLRERRGDILPLARHFLEFYRTRLALAPTELSPEAAERLLEHSWPGNIRELENAMHHALLLSQGARITPADLRLSSVEPRSYDAAAFSALSSSVVGAESALERALLDLIELEVPNLFEHVEGALMRTAYRYSANNQLQTARLLGISRNVVRARLIRFGEITGAVRGTPKVRALEARENIG